MDNNSIYDQRAARIGFSLAFLGVALALSGCGGMTTLGDDAYTGSKGYRLSASVTRFTPATGSLAVRVIVETVWYEGVIRTYRVTDSLLGALRGSYEKQSPKLELKTASVSLFQVEDDLRVGLELRKNAEVVGRMPVRPRVLSDEILLISADPVIFRPSTEQTVWLRIAINRPIEVSKFREQVSFRGERLICLTCESQPPS